MEPAQCRLDTPAERVDSSTTVVSASHRRARDSAAGRRQRDGSADRDGFRRPRPQPPAAGQVPRRPAESDTGSVRRGQRLALQQTLNADDTVPIQQRMLHEIHLKCPGETPRA